MMFKDKHIHKLYAFALAAVFALTLAGCGGGGGTATDPEPTPMECPAGTTGTYPDCMTPEQIEAQKLQTAQNAAMSAYTMAMGYVGNAVDPVAMANAQMYADMAEDASDMAAAATTSAMAEEYQMKAEMYRDNARTASMAAGLGATMLANRQLNKTPDDVQEPPEPPTPILNTKNVLAEINTVAQTAIPRSATATPPAVTVTYGTTAKGVSFSATDYAAGEMPRSFMMDGFMGTELVKDEVGTVDSVNGKTYLVVYSDRAQDTSVTSYADSTTRSALPDLTTYPDVTTFATTHVTSLSEGQIAGKMGDMLMGTYNADPKDDTPAREGVFYCNAAVCTATVNAQGMITANTGYDFRSVSEKVTKMDTNYLTLGFWLTAPTELAADGTAPGGIVVGAFGMGQGTAVNATAALKGTAIYEGIATGLYATKTAINYFKGDATLEANFGAVKDTASGQAGFFGSVSGSISNIVAGGVGMSGELGLSDANIAIDGSGYSGNTKGTVGTGRFTGSWSGAFYEAAKTTLPAADQHPLSTAGTFSGYDEFNGSSILGAFGANKQ